MYDLSYTAYNIVKALHIISFTAWMAGLLYLPRLFVYHTQAAAGSEQAATFSIMEKRLLRIIMGPAMTLTWVFGLVMLFSHDMAWFKMNIWLHIKITLVILLTGYHHALIKYQKRFAAGENEKSAKFYRILNEIPTVFLIGIVMLAVVKWPISI